LLREPGLHGAAGREDGVVLLLILVVIVLTIGSVYTFGRTTILDIMSSRQRTARVRAELLAHSGVEIAKRTLTDDLFMAEDPLTVRLESPGDPWRILSQTPIELPGEGTLRIRIQDSGSRIALNALVDADGKPHLDSRPFLIAALERIIDKMPGRKEDKTYEIPDLADGILDWLDSDEETRLGDNEADFYRQAGRNSSPLNRPVFSLDELSVIPDLDGLLLEALKDYFSPYPMFPDIERSGVNPNTAPAHILGMIYHGTAQKKQLLDRDDVFRILQAREEEKVFCEGGSDEGCESFTALTGFAGETIFPPLRYRSDLFMIHSEARVGETRETRACIRTVIDRGVADEEPRVLLYRMGC